jgi:hypothetical protein
MSERPGSGELLAGIAGLVLLLSMFIFAWFGLEGFTGDAFDTLDDWVNIVLVFTAFAGMALALFGSDVSRAEAAPLSAVTVALGGISALIILIHIIAPPGIETGVGSVDFDPEFGVWVGLLASIAVAIGGYLSMQEEGAASVGVGGVGAAPGGLQPPAPPPSQQAPPPPTS